MFEKKKEIVRRLFEELPSLKLSKYEDREARELIFDQLGTSISSGGRAFLLSYLGASIFIPLLFSKLPSILIRGPLFINFVIFHNELYYFGANLMLYKNSSSFIAQMQSLKEGSKLKEFAESL